MNIFVLDKNPILAAQYMCDIHVQSKMIIESGQMIANCFSLERLAKRDCPKTQGGNCRKHSYLHHPCSKWTMINQENMSWLMYHALSLVTEKKYRWPDKSQHFTTDFISWAWDNRFDCNVPEGKLTEFPIAIGKESECRKVPNFDKLSRVEQYKLYYKIDKVKIATWTKREVPKWMV